jgi:hypothetical protein
MNAQNCWIQHFSITFPHPHGRPWHRSNCNPKSLWKLSWFLRDFGYDAELLDHDEVDERQVVGLQGVVKVSHVVHDGIPLLRLDGFAPAGRWDVLSPANLDAQTSR